MVSIMRPFTPVCVHCARLLTLNSPCQMAEVYCPRMRGGCLAAMLKKERRSSSVCMHTEGKWSSLHNLLQPSLSVHIAWTAVPNR